MDSFTRYSYSGYLNMITIINNLILNLESGAPFYNPVKLNVAVGAQKYYTYKQDMFGELIGFILPFFLVIAYVCPLCVLVYRIVSEKESRAKEGMKIMGLTEGVYFSSYFIQYICLNTIYSIVNSIILLFVFHYVGYIWIFSFFWLYGMTIFSIGYFFASFMDRTRVAMIITLLLYFLMFFVSVVVYNPQSSKGLKTLASIFPPKALQLGIFVLSRFETSFKQFSGDYLFYDRNNFNVGTMNILLFIDFFIFLFLGYYLQNVISHQYGQKKPFYFLFTKKFWCKKKSNVYSFENNQTKRISSLKKDNYQDESYYDEKIKNGECLRLVDIVKVFDDGKKAVDELSLNIYKEEIFALLGHNGAGKTTLISIFCGLYEKTAGEAFHNNEDIFENMEEFRKKVGICPQHDVLFDKLTVKEHLEMFSIFKGVKENNIKSEIDKVIKVMELEEKENVCAEALSGGQKRKLSIGIALLGGSEIVFLDEPSSGMDITSRRALWDILKRCIGNRIIVLTTHYMEEAAILGNRIGIVANGKLKCCGTSLFLINKFGKYISLTIVKDKLANDKKIIEFVKSNLSNSIECDLYSEEILIRISKNNDLNENLKEFFKKLDENINLLDIKSYSASMPTLEDVFLNVSAEVKLDEENIINMNSDNKIDNNIRANENMDSKLLDFANYSYDQYERSVEGEIKGVKIIFTHLAACLTKRFLQIIRDKKTFVLEVFCPILLIFTGLLTTSVRIINDSSPKQVKMDLLPYPQNIRVNSIPFLQKDLDPKAIFVDKAYEKFEFLDINKSTVTDALVEFNNQLFSKINNTNYLAGYYMLNADSIQNTYDAVLFVNTVSQDGCEIFLQDFFNSFISSLVGKTVEINFTNSPLPMTLEDKTKIDLQSSQNLIFFITVAFSLIPANFITIIIKERETNTKHLQIISGISYTSYWISNFIFELVKYLFTGGVCIGLTFLFRDLSTEDKNIIIILYFLYGLGMISITYLFSFVFVKESSAQNFTILFNYLFGPLSCTVVFILRVTPSTKNVAKVLSLIFPIFPSFSFAYGMNQLFRYIMNKFSKNLLQFIDDPFGPKIDILSFEYVGKSIVFLIITFVIYMITLCVIEFFGNKFQLGQSSYDNSIANIDNIQDNEVLEEIKKANQDNEELNKNYSIRLKNLEKTYGNCFEDKKLAVNKLSFCLNNGDCFALLGLNGDGKTTTFKCLTSEIFPSKGSIYINNLELHQNFDLVRKLIGYCPQFDSLFDYLTVKENLEFFAKIKGIPYHLV